MNELCKVALFQVIGEVPMGVAMWDPLARVQPLSALADITPDLDRKMMDPNLPMTKKEADNYALTYEIAYLNLTRGNASDETFNCILHGLHLATVFARMGYGEDWLPELSHALESLDRAAERGQKTGSWRLDGEGMKDVRTGIDVLIGQLAIVPRKKFPGAIPVLEKILRDLGLIS